MKEGFVFMGGSSQYFMNESKEFVIENYNQAKPFSSFLPAVAGLYGKPLWAYYVNRGQCISTFGVNNKDNAIMEFNPANKAYRFTQREGFRTFLKVTKGGETVFCEPFQDVPGAQGVQQSMFITSHDIRIEDINTELGIKTEVMFCTLPGERLAALVRRVAITNISGEEMHIEVADGAPALLPYFLTDADIKAHSNLRQAWVRIEHYDKIPFYKLDVLPDDTAETEFITGGNFYMSFCFKQGQPNLCRTVVEPTVLFGNVTDFTYPSNFMEGTFTVPERQAQVGVTPCCFGVTSFTIQPGDAENVYSLAGYSDSYEKVESYCNETLNERYLLDKIEENKIVVDRIKQYIFTVSDSDRFDLYSGQSMLDNVLRGGHPIDIGGHSYYVYSRKHGDLEREYNFFQVDSTYFSQGNANFRDVNQNRRNDVMFFPFIGNANVKTFFNLIQLDGYNPLVVMGASFRVSDKNKLDVLLREYIADFDRDKLRAFLTKPFTPGALMAYMEENGIYPESEQLKEFLHSAVKISDKNDEADFKEGYWVDHWTYNTDLLTQFMTVFPDKTKELLFKDKGYTYYDSYEFVAPRSQKHVLTDRGVRQYGATKVNKDKLALIEERGENRYLVRCENGRGDVYRTTLIAKIFTILVNKIATLDPEGTGVEMEAGKPGWCDALNGMPGILGSSINESAEVGRLARLILDVTSSMHGEIVLHEELFDFYHEIKKLENAEGYGYWDKSSAAREAYRERVAFGVSGIEKPLAIPEARKFLEWVIKKVDAGLSIAYDKQSGGYATFFINEVTEYESLDETNESGLPLVKALSFKQRPIANFLEGPVHVLRTHPEEVKPLFNAVKKMGLYDETLDMYKVNDNIMFESREIGRQNAFPRGWLENEAVFLHMEYKYFLELLRCGLHKEFYHYFENSMVPFLDPSVYGRSILENCTFIVSTVHPDPDIHGSGYVSRLTGASAEFLHMWLIMTVGLAPFGVDENGSLTLAPKPILAGWLFTKDEQTVRYYDKLTGWKDIIIPAGCFAFNFLGETLTVYHNGKRKDTYGDGCAEVSGFLLSEGDKTIPINGSEIPAPYARQVRDGAFNRIDVYFN